MTQNEIINTVARINPRDYFVTDDGRFGIGMTAKSVIVVTDARSTQIKTLGRFRTRAELYRFLSKRKPTLAQVEDANGFRYLISIQPGDSDARLLERATSFYDHKMVKVIKKS
jgi:hypothetical protein